PAPRSVAALSCGCPLRCPLPALLGRLEGSGEIGPHPGVLVPVPRLPRPDLQPVRHPDHDRLAGQGDLLAQLLWHDQPSLLIERQDVCIAEEHPRVVASGPAGQWSRPRVLSPALPLLPGEGVDAAVLAERDEDALAERV